MHSQDRAASISKMFDVLGSFIIREPATNLHYLYPIFESRGIQRGETLTNYITTSFAYNYAARV
jgi:biotin carboxylase